MLQLAFASAEVRAFTRLGVVRAFVDMALVTLHALLAVPQHSKRAAHEWAGGHLDMGIAAYIVRAIAVKRISACWDALVGWYVRKVAVVAFWTAAGVEVRFADGDFFGVVVEAALGSVWAGTCKKSETERVLTDRLNIAADLLQSAGCSM